MIITKVINDRWDEKVNFTDENDVFVGYDTAEHCCEFADWYITDEVILCTGTDLVFDLEGYTFDKDYFKSVDNEDYDVKNYAIFRLVKSDHKDLYLHLFNHHNGHYSHGFEAKVGGEVWQEGML